MDQPPPITAPIDRRSRVPAPVDPGRVPGAGCPLGVVAVRTSSAKNLPLLIPTPFKLFKPFKLFRFFKPFAAVIRHLGKMGYHHHVLVANPPLPARRLTGVGIAW